MAERLLRALYIRHRNTAGFNRYQVVEVKGLLTRRCEGLVIGRDREDWAMK